VRLPFNASSATFALNSGLWFFRFDIPLAFSSKIRKQQIVAYVSAWISGGAHTRKFVVVQLVYKANRETAWEFLATVLEAVQSKARVTAIRRMFWETPISGLIDEFFCHTDRSANFGEGFGQNQSEELIACVRRSDPLSNLTFTISAVQAENPDFQISEFFNTIRKKQTFQSFRVKDVVSDVTVGSTKANGEVWAFEIRITPRENKAF
jgi:hypothetical protein